jgi:hypothetical protein
MIIGYSRASAAPPPSDPNWANVKLLMGFEGANASIGSPGMDDISSAAHGTASGGNASFSAINTAQQKFGSSSLYLSGNSIWFGDSADWAFGSGTFTIETFIRPTSIGSMQFLVCQFGAIAPNLGWVLYMNASGTLGWNVSTTGSDNLNDMTSSGALSNGVWRHVCVDYDGTKYRMYLDGAMVASSTTARTIYHPSQNLGIGSNSNQSAFEFQGYMDELRITKGVARYASDSGFTAPTSAFPRS